jgi:nitrogen fixation protein
MGYQHLLKINVTNVFPTEPAPPGLNYYVPIKDLPFVHSWDWDSFFYDVYETTTIMSGLRTTTAFGPEWLNLQYLSAADRDRVQTLGYNPLFNMAGVGPVVWGNEVVGSAWHLPELMTGLQVVEDLMKAVNYMLEKKQFELFPELGQQLNMTAAKVSHVIREHRFNQNLYFRDSDDLYGYKIIEDWGWRIEVPILPLMAIKPIVLDIRYETKTGKVAFVMPNDCKETYAMWNLLFLGGAPRELEILCAK